MTEAGRDTVAVIGSGAIGGYLAGRLSEAGRDVTSCVRTPFDVLTVTSGGETRTIPVRIATDPADVSPVRWILLTTKSQDTAATEPWVKALAGPGTTLVMVQNGIGHRERARPIANGAAVLPAVIWCSVERTAPGTIVHHGAAKITVPSGPEGAAFARLFAGTEFRIEETDEFQTVAWRKFITNVVASTLTALTLRRAAVLKEPEIAALSRRIIAEAIAVGRAEGAALTDEDQRTAEASLGRNGPDSGTSMLYDRLAGRPLEHRALTGALVEAADRHGIDVPVNRTLLALLEAVSRQDLAAVS